MDWLTDHWLDILGWGGSALLVFSLMQARVLRFRVLNLIACLVLTAFNGLLEIWPMVAMNVVLCAINIWFIVKLVGTRDDDTVFEVLEVRPDDAYLFHVLVGSSADIAKFQPDFDAPGPDDTVYLVQKGQETVGVVVLAISDGTARVRLDYVTPRFRDFSPGRFVWRRLGTLREAGVRRVVTSPAMVAPYYAKLGFRPEDGAFVLEL
ncbi:hypothetical protein ncot_06570 [Nocardioides sp. JQ2195]|uniref:hypothetical protein n=1 Tax=Nocardioides sp. JQ2195 TaxID=2592334 RepID=UPI00143EE2DC|nr:hypothetical protein [Nocardioides sp. JQ2195]QIX26303.1 hypothetical protein ncot_06570 [Nocardioides sp. JQ2195]